MGSLTVTIMSSQNHPRALLADAVEAPFGQSMCHVVRIYTRKDPDSRNSGGAPFLLSGEKLIPYVKM